MSHRMTTKIDRLANRTLDRRRLLGNLGLIGAGAALTACSGVIATPGMPTDEDYDAAILNFALNLEYLEAAFYLAAVGRLSDLPGYDAAKIDLPQSYSDNGDRANLDATTMAYASEIADDELAHVEFLRAALDAAGAPVAELPSINLDSSFRTAAAAAGLSADNGFDPFADPLFFLHGAYIFEDVGVTAYKGAARFLTNKDYLEAAAGILAVEAYHAGEVRTLLYGQRDAVAAEGLTVAQVTGAISDARDALDQGNAGDNTDLDQGIVANGGANIVPTDANGIAFGRTPLQVANIVYLSAETAVTADSFFPEGIDTAGLDADFEFLLGL